MNAINWMIKNAHEIEVLNDGTVSFYFNGTLPAKMVREIKGAASNYRDAGKTVTYSGGDDVTGWGATFGARKSTANTVRFSYNDYTVPASKAV